MLEALWSVEFQSNQGYIGGGVAVLETGRVFGGDSNYFYVGSYSPDREWLSVDITVTHFAGDSTSVFGTAKTLKLVLKGKPAREGFDLLGHIQDDRTQEIAIHLIRRAELP